MKLKTMLAVVAGALGLCASAEVTVLNGTSFEGKDAGTVLPADIPDDSGVTWEATDAENTKLNICTYDDDAYTYSQDGTNPRLSKFGATQDNCLNVDTKIGKPLYRNVDATMGSYFDSLVKFTACDTVPESYENAKLIVYVLENEEVTPWTTNLFVRAQGGDYDLGYIDYSDWHRLTIKSFSNVNNVSGKPVPGFALYLDGNPLDAKDGDYADKCGATEASLSNNAKVLYKAKKLFLSLDPDGDDGDTIKGVGFDGKGWIDDVALTADAPIPAAADLKFATVKIGEKIASFVVDGVMYTTDADAQIIGGKVAVSEITYNPGYFGPDYLELGANSGDELELDHEAKDIVAKILDKNYASIEEALDEAQDDDVIVLQANVDVEVETTITVEKSVTIDLNGWTVTGAENVGVFTIEVGTAVTFIDESEAGTGAVKAQGTGYAAYLKAPGEGEEGESASLSISGGTFAGVAEDGDFGGDDRTLAITLTGGWFLNDPNDTYLEGTGYEAVQDETHDNYWKVQEKQIKQGTVIILVDGDVKTTLDPQEVGTTVDLTAIDGLKETWQKLNWADVKDPTAYEVVEGEQTLSATTDIDLTFNVDCYEIGSADNLKTLADAVAGGYDTTDKTFKQTDDINWQDEDGVFPGIGTYSNSDSSKPGFKGTYDGNDKAINNIKVASAKYAGIFTQLYGTVQNLTVEDVSVDGTIDYSTQESTAAHNKGAYVFTSEVGGAMVVSHVWGGTVKNVTTKGAFGSTEAPLTGSAGGIVCRVTGNATIENCVNEADLYGASAKIAGIMIICQAGADDAGEDGKGVVIKNCENKGSINWVNKGSDDVAGGYAGIAAYVGNGKKVKIEGCTNSGAVNCTLENADVGQIVGKITGSSVVVTAGTFTVAADQLVIGSTALDGFNFATIDDTAVTLVADNALAVGGSYKVMSPRKGADDANKATATIEFTAAEQTVSFDQSLATAKFAITSTTGVIATNEAENVITFTAKAAPVVDDPTVTDPTDIPAGTKVSEIFKDVPADLANADASKFATWCQGKAIEGGASVGAAGAEAKLDAFLLNCANDETAVEAAKEAFKIPEITVNADGSVTVTSPEGTYNGTVTIKGSATVDGKYELDADNAEAKFFKAILSL